MNYRIEEKDGFRIFGVSTQLNWESDYYEDASAFVDKCVNDGTGQKILDVIGMGDINQFLTEPNEDGTLKQIGLFAHYNWNKTGVKFMIAMDHPGQNIPVQFEELNIPKSSWAVFTASAPISNKQMIEHLSIEQIWKRLHEWFQVSEYEQREGVPEIQKTYINKTEFIEEVWIPIIKK